MNFSISVDNTKEIGFITPKYCIALIISIYLSFGFVVLFVEKNSTISNFGNNWFAKSLLVSI